MGFIAPMISSITPFFHGKANQFKINPLVVHKSTHPHISDVHWHDYAQLWYCSEGSYVHTVNGERVLQTPGTVCIVPPFAIHSIDTTKTNFEKADISYISLDGDRIQETQIPFFTLKYNLSTFENFLLHPFVRLGGRDKELCDELFAGMMRQSSDASPIPFSKALESTAKILELCAKNVNTKISSIDLISAREQATLLKNSLEYITENSTSKVLLAKASRIAMMSERSFTGKFKGYTGQTAHNYLINIRIMRAFKLLRYTDYSISDISQMCGFSNSAHFIKLCMRNLEASPSTVRESIRSWDETYCDDMLSRGNLKTLLNTWK